MTSVQRHEYLSTACWHEINDGRPELHAACRATCKFGDEPCVCPNHPESGGRPAAQPWVDQARDVARRLLSALEFTGVDLAAVDPDLHGRLRGDPDLFWLRGEEPPPGEWRPVDAGEARKDTPDA